MSVHTLTLNAMPTSFGSICILFSLLAKTSLLPLSAMAAAEGRLTPFPGEKPLASEVLDWIETNKPRLSADERAFADGYTPRSLLAYSAHTVPVALAAGGDVTESMVANRDVVRQTKIGDNIKLARQLAAH